jgi:Bacterial SH3 domain
MNSFLNSLRNGILVTAGLLIVPVLGLAPQAMAQDPAAPAKEATLVGQCRAANKRTPIYSARNPTSEVVTLLETGNAVILSENGGENGLIGVSKPKVGFVHSPNLKDCPGKPKPTTPTAENPKPTPDKPIAGICRKVVQPQGLIVRNEAGNVAPIVGSLALNEKVTLAEPIETVERDDGRIWIKVAKPVAGWTSNGFVKQQFRNLGACE